MTHGESTRDWTPLQAWWRAADHRSIGQVHLVGNPLLREPRTLEHVRPCLLASGAASPVVLDELARATVAGQVTVPIAATHPLASVRDAFAELEQRHTRGTIVLLP